MLNRTILLASSDHRDLKLHVSGTVRAEKHLYLEHYPLYTPRILFLKTIKLKNVLYITPCIQCRAVLLNPNVSQVHSLQLGTKKLSYHVPVTFIIYSQGIYILILEKVWSNNPFAQNPHQTVTCGGYNGFSAMTRRFLVPQILQFCLLTKPLRLKCASSLMIK